MLPRCSIRIWRCLGGIAGHSISSPGRRSGISDQGLPAPARRRYPRRVAVGRRRGLCVARGALAGRRQLLQRTDAGGTGRNDHRQEDDDPGHAGIEHELQLHGADRDHLGGRARAAGRDRLCDLPRCPALRARGRRPAQRSACVARRGRAGAPAPGAREGRPPAAKAQSLALAGSLQPRARRRRGRGGRGERGPGAGGTGEPPPSSSAAGSAPPGAVRAASWRKGSQSISAASGSLTIPNSTISSHTDISEPMLLLPTWLAARKQGSRGSPRR